MNLSITFELGTDLDQAQVLVQNRVALAEPRLPEEVRRQEGRESSCGKAGGGKSRSGCPCGSDHSEPASGLAVPDGEQALTGEAREKPGTSVPGFFFLPRQPPMCQAMQAWTDAHPHPSPTPRARVLLINGVTAIRLGEMR